MDQLNYRFTTLGYRPKSSFQLLTRFCLQLSWTPLFTLSPHILNNIATLRVIAREVAVDDSAVLCDEVLVVQATVAARSPTQLNLVVFNQQTTNDIVA
jgi:hypothetical protein